MHEKSYPKNKNFCMDEKKNLIKMTKKKKTLEDFIEISTHSYAQ